MIRSQKFMCKQLFVSVLCLSFLSCVNRKFSQNYDSTELPDFDQEKNRSQQMRDLFFTYAKNANQNLSEEDFKSLYYLRSETQNFADIQSNIRHAENSQSRFLNTFFRTLKPSDLYESGVNIPLKSIFPLNKNIESNGPITYVLFPGITVEFSFSKPFHEIVSNQKSSFSKAAKNAILASSESLHTDPQFSLSELGEVPSKIENYMDFASLDSNTGKPLAQFIYLKPELGSLETLGYNTDNAKTYVRRLDKAFDILNSSQIDTNTIVFIGYSRGVTVGLTTLSDLNKRQKTNDKKAWFDHVKGFVNIAGVVYGNELADTYSNDSTNPNYVMLQKIDSLANNLKDEESGVHPMSRTRSIAENSKSWMSMIRSVPSLPPATTYPGLQQEKLSAGLPNLVSMIGFLRNVFFDVFQPTEYFRDVQRLKILNTKLKQGLESCTRKTMRSWWQTSDLPTSIQYYNFLATQGDLTEPNAEPWKLTKNELAYGRNSVDYPVNRASYYELARLTGSDRVKLDGESVNDGAVEASAGYMHNGFIQSLNPSQKKLKISFLGYLATHHWGTVMPYGVKSTLSSGANPYPRVAFINALSEFIAQDIAAQ
jgi:hypothetical protein